MRLRKASITLGASMIGASILGASILVMSTFAANSASAGLFYDGIWSGRGGFSSYQLYRRPQPNASLRGAMSRPSNRDMQAPFVGWGMRGMSGSRMNGGMRRR